MYRILWTVIFLFAISFSQSGKPLPSKTTTTSGVPSASLLNINTFSAWYESNGIMENNPYTGNSGGNYPKGTVGAIYSSGIMWGGYINDGAMDFIQPRVSGQMYNSGTTPGAILGTKTGIVENPADSAVRIYRIRRDFVTADLKQDAAELNSIELSRVTDIHTTAVREQYKKDWKEWPAQKGAPFYDAEKDGLYNPKFILVNGKEVPLNYPLADEPGYANADQVIWFVANDTRDSLSPWKTRSAGLEEQVTIWGYNRPSNEALGNTIFKKFKFIFKGTNVTKDTTKITKMYMGHWVDPDLGDYGDDHVGVDSAMGLGYVYNAQYNDREYQKFNLSPPAIGYLLLQGPVVPSPSDTAVISFGKKYGYRNLPVTSFSYHATGGDYSDPPFALNGSWQHYSQLMGLPPTPQPPPFPDPVINPITKTPTRFWLDGDPVTSTGWNDGKNEKAGDRRFFLSTGPFELALNDTQEIVFALIGASASDRSGNITLLKDYARNVMQAYANGFAVQIPTFTAAVQPLTDSTAAVTITASSVRGVYKSHAVDLVRNNGSTISSLQLYDDGSHNDGGFNDGIFGNSDTLSAELDLITIRGRSTTFQGVTTIFDYAVRQVSVPGTLHKIIPDIYFDNIDNNRKVSRGEYVRFGLTVKNTTPYILRGLTAVPKNSLSIGSAHSFKNLMPGEQASMTYDPLDPTTYFTVRIPSDQVNAYDVPFIFRDSTGNKWAVSVSLPLYERIVAQDSVRNGAVDIIGRSDVSVDYVLHNPDVIGQQYDMLFVGGTVNSPATTQWTLVKVDSSGPFLTMNCVIGEQSQPPYNRGDGVFTLNRQKDSLKYSIRLRNLYGPVTSAYLRVDTTRIKTLQFSGDSAQGWMTKYDSADRWHDSLTAKLSSGKIEVVTISGGGYLFKGFVTNGLIPRRPVYVWPAFQFTDSVARSPVASYNEAIVEGFSLFAAMYPPGIKEMIQTAPDTVRVITRAHPSRNYRIGSNNPISNKITSKDIQIHFNGMENWAMAVPTTWATPPLARPIRVPFAVYLDTVRVWPVILKKNLATDTMWRMDDTLANGQVIFDQILGIVDERDVTNYDTRYYSSVNAVFPPTSNSYKGRLINSANHVAREIYFANTNGSSASPSSGTRITIRTVKLPQSGDVKRITLQRAPSGPGSFPVVPSTYVLENNFPNPFNPLTNIRYGVPRRSYVTLAVYDILGRKVRTLVVGESQAGTFTVRWDGRSDDGRTVSSGVYFSRLVSEGFAVTKKMMLVR
jgi:hypothetical protein